MDKRIVKLSRSPFAVNLSDQVGSLFIDSTSGSILLDEGEGEGRVNGVVLSPANRPRFSVTPSGPSGGLLELHYCAFHIVVGTGTNKAELTEWAEAANAFVASKEGSGKPPAPTDAKKRELPSPRRLSPQNRLAAFVDNRDGHTLDAALAAQVVAARNGAGARLDIAAGFFDLDGFQRLYGHLRADDTVRLLLGAESPRECDLPELKPGDLTGPERDRELVKSALYALNSGLARARDTLPFDLSTDRAIGQLLGLLAAKRLEVRRVEHQFLPARCALVRSAKSAFVGGVNLSRHGLIGEPAVAVGLHATPAAERLGTWFEELWGESAAFDLATLYQPLTANFDPYLIYVRILFALYGDELDEEGKESGAIPVTSFQQHGVWRALSILKRYGGVLIADGVGLGKTFTAGEIIRLYRERRQRVLLVCPAALRDSTWDKFINKYELFVTCVSYEQLAGDGRFCEGGPDYLKADLDDFALVVVDEGHNYRNPGAPARAGVLRQLLAGKPRDVVFLTATPVNNSLWDLYHLLRYFLKNDGKLGDRGVLSVRDRFKEAMTKEPAELNPDTLYPILDATTVKRTRYFIKKHYEDATIKLPDGTVTPIRFPKPVPSSITYDLDGVLPGFLARLELALMPATGEPQLTMARYQTEDYAKGAGTTEEHMVVGLLRSAILKRFESSVHAFARTTGKMVKEHEAFLNALDRGRVMHKEVMRELSASEDADADELLDELTDADLGSPVAGYDVRRLRTDVQNDLAVLREFHNTAAAITADKDPKLAKLLDELAAIATQADKDGIDEEDRRQNRKVLIFSFYEDSVDWIETFLRARLSTDKRLAAYKDRIASVAGTDSRHGVNRQAATAGFAPVSVTGKTGQPDKFDILISTDVLAEGMNLQQARNIINYDLPWNPMRLVQRHGRIDRIGSLHKEVYLRTFFPDKELNRLLALEQRVRRKLAQAAASVGVEVAPITGFTETDVFFADTREEIERLRRGDPTLFERGGTAGAAQTGEEYRQELRKALQRMGDTIRKLPWRSGSGLCRGKVGGHLFCATIGDRVFVRFVPFDGSAIIEELATCLRMIESAPETPRVMPADLLAGVYEAWERARANIETYWHYHTDPANLQPRVPPFNRELADFLRNNPPAGTDHEQLARYIGALEAPLPRREEMELRRVFDADYPGNRAKADAVARSVEQLGLEPFVPPAPLPPITADQVHLICWMAVESEKA